MNKQVVQGKSIQLTNIRKSWEKPVIERKWLYYILQTLVVIGLLTGFTTFFLSLAISLFLLVWFKLLSIDAIKRNFNFDLLVVNSKFCTVQFVGFRLISQENVLHVQFIFL